MILIVWKTPQVSYLIVDEADRDIELGKDPFLEAGIVIPEELPYQDPKLKELKGNLSKSSSLASLATSHFNLFRRRRSSTPNPFINIPQAKYVRELSIIQSAGTPTSSTDINIPESDEEDNANKSNPGYMVLNGMRVMTNKHHKSKVAGPKGRYLKRSITSITN